MRSKALFLLAAALLMTGCATMDIDIDGRDDFGGSGDTEDLREVAITPASDLNIESIEIPPYLLNMTNPYIGQYSQCAPLLAEISKLDGLLGADLDVPEEEAERRERVALNAASDTLGSLIPFRGVVRAVSGASAHARKAREAYERGLVRRAYLKGQGQKLGCQ